MVRHCQRKGCGSPFWAEGEARFCGEECYPSAQRGYVAARRKALGLRACRQAQHGMDDETWRTFIAKAKCDACGSIDPGSKNGFAVDHDHLCCPGNFGCPKCVRGLLCHGCNVALGMVKDDADRLLDLYAYLYRDQGMPAPKAMEALNG